MYVSNYDKYFEVLQSQALSQDCDVILSVRYSKCKERFVYKVCIMSKVHGEVGTRYFNDENKAHGYFYKLMK